MDESRFKSILAAEKYLSLKELDYSTINDLTTAEIRWLALLNTIGSLKDVTKI